MYVENKMKLIFNGGSKENIKTFSIHLNINYTTEKDYLKYFFH